MHAIQAQLVVPLVAFLAGRASEFSHRNCSACARALRPRIQRPESRVVADARRTDRRGIQAHLDEVSATEKFIVPESIVDEVLEVCDRLGISAMPDIAEVAFPEPATR